MSRFLHLGSMAIDPITVSAFRNTPGGTGIEFLSDGKWTLIPDYDQPLSTLLRTINKHMDKAERENTKVIPDAEELVSNLTEEAREDLELEVKEGLEDFDDFMEVHMWTRGIVEGSVRDDAAKVLTRDLERKGYEIYKEPTVPKGDDIGEYRLVVTANKKRKAEEPANEPERKRSRSRSPPPSSRPSSPLPKEAKPEEIPDLP